MGEFVILIRKDGRSVPRFDTKEGGLDLGRRPEGDGREIGIIYLNAFPGSRVDELYTF